MFPSVLFLVYFLFCRFLLSEPPDRISQYVKRAADEDNIVFIRLFHRLFQSICHAPRYLVLRPDFLPVNHFTDFFRRPCPRCRRGAGINLVPFSYEHLNNGFRRFILKRRKNENTPFIGILFLQCFLKRFCCARLAAKERLSIPSI